MLPSETLREVLIVAPHADDDVLGAGGLAAHLAPTGCAVHVVFGVVDGFHHYGVGGEHVTALADRTDEIAAVAELYGWTHETLYEGKELIERLDTVPRRDLVDAFEAIVNQRRPDLVLLPVGIDYDQDHVAVFQAAHAALRPIAPQFGKHLAPHVWCYESPKLGWNPAPLPDMTTYLPLTEDELEAKLEGLRRYATQLRPSPHIRSVEAIRALAELRGKEIGVRYAEAYQTLRSVIA